MSLDELVSTPDFSVLTRRAIEACIEKMIELLDIVDGDADLEPVGDDEPSLAGWAGGRSDLEGDGEFYAPPPMAKREARL